MQEERVSGESILTDSPDIKRVEQALADEKNKAVHLYKPGMEVTLASGRKYRVGPNGNWIRIA